jgi:hypothetical protein
MVCMDFLAFLTKTRSNAVQLEFDEIDAQVHSFAGY